MRNHVVHLEKKSLKRILKVGDLFAVGYGDVGSSLYYALGATALYALGATPIALAIAGFVFICTALTYAELGSTFAEPGGSATFARHAFNDLISFIAGWGLLLDYIVTIAISAFAIPPYLSHILELAGVPVGIVESTPVHIGMTLCIILFLLFLNIVGIKHSTRMSFYLAMVTIVTQLLIIAIGLLFILNLPLVISHLRIGVAGVDWSPNWPQFLKGTAMAMVAYTGIESITQLTGEAKHPGVVVPSAIRRAMVILVVLYLGISVVGLSAVSPVELGTTYLMDPIAGIVLHFPVGGELLAPWVGLMAAILLLIASNGGLIGSSRLTFSMGEYYQVPYLFYRTHPRFRTPHISLMVFAALACLLVIVSRGHMLFLADLYNFGAMIAFCSAHASLIILRIKQPDLERPYRAPFNIPIGKNRSIPLTAMIGVLATFATWLVVVVTKMEGRNLGLLWIGAGLMMYFYYRLKKRIAPMGRLEIEKIRIPEYAPMQIKNILVTARLTDRNESVQLACELAKLHGANITAVHVIEVPYTMPIDTPLAVSDERGKAALKRAEAIAREHRLTIEIELIRSRSLEEAYLSLIENKHFDLVVIGAAGNELDDPSAFGYRAKKIFSDAACRVWFCKSASAAVSLPAKKHAALWKTASWGSRPSN
jgi:basic amino acid/polyamine antiporter, APA family